MVCLYYRAQPVLTLLHFLVLVLVKSCVYNNLTTSLQVFFLIVSGGVAKHAYILQLYFIYTRLLNSQKKKTESRLMTQFRITGAGVVLMETLYGTVAQTDEWVYTCCHYRGHKNWLWSRRKNIVKFVLLLVFEVDCAWSFLFRRAIIMGLKDVSRACQSRASWVHPTEAIEKTRQPSSTRGAGVRLNEPRRRQDWRNRQAIKCWHYEWFVNLYAGCRKAYITFLQICYNNCIWVVRKLGIDHPHPVCGCCFWKSVAGVNRVWRCNLLQIYHTKIIWAL